MRLGQSFHYMLTLWNCLTRFLEYSVLELNNNLAEKVACLVVLGRKN